MDEGIIGDMSCDYSNKKKKIIMKKSLIGEKDKNGTVLKVGDIINDFNGGVNYAIEDRDDGITTKYTNKYKRVGNTTRYGEIVITKRKHDDKEFFGIRTNPKINGMNYAYIPSSFSRFEKVGDMDNDSHLMDIDTRTSDEEMEILVAKMRKEHADMPKGEDWGYYLMSEDMFKTYQPKKGSKPLFRNGDIFTGPGAVYIGYLDFEDFQDFYANMHRDHVDEFSLWAQEITESNVNNFDIMDILTSNLFEYILYEFGASTESNVCAIIGSMSNYFGMTPIELFDYINENSQTEKIWEQWQ